MITPPRTGQKFSYAVGLALVLGALLLGGCSRGEPGAGASDADRARLADLAPEGRAVFSPGSGARDADSPDPTWTIVLSTIPASQEGLEVMRTVATVRQQAGLPEARLLRRGRSTVVAYGSYPSATDERARADLARVRAIELNGERPFEHAVLAPPAFEGVQGGRPELDLAGVRARRGGDALYTLQVAAYERSDGKDPTDADLAEIRAAAEKAAETLRADGADAYYWHGPRRSMVTVGIFGPADHDVLRPERDSPALRAARSKHPLNLVNGRPLLVRTRGQTESTPQPSFLVAIPE
ncbi:MAG: hypothetical protein SFY69_02145 [Planctomycetota bacterium]|nr:hypothetical protein [Planctomycetota bacterium]